MHGIVQHNYRSIRAQLLLKLQVSHRGGSYACFEAMRSLDKSSFDLGNELWEEHFESLLALVKAYIIDTWEERKSRLYTSGTVVRWSLQERKSRAIVSR